MSSFYEVGLELQRRIMFDRVGTGDGRSAQGSAHSGGRRSERASGRSTSWLARQREQQQ